ncbi:kelch-like protein 8 [Dorcoceras hygrometricum]|uniref:Kelch-like protein 8 n=1 Tax=Dorcoceras hygrometricum TaxID=472368 RepID=A0A2Z7BE73_9LAMI|nr:kelch-like protein 8 [Dorcoceras hygrometricum]
MTYSLLATMVDPDPVSRGRSGNQKLPRETFNTFKSNSINIHRAAVERQSGPRPESRHLCQPALEGLTNSARTETPQRGGWNKSGEGATTGGGVRLGEEGRPKSRSRDVWIQLAVGPQPLWLRNHNFGLAQRIMVKRLATSPHDPLGITDSACKNQLVMVSVQYGPFNTYIPIRSTTIGKSRVARDPIATDISWRSNSDIASVTRVSMMFRVVRTNKYNQELGLFHSTNGNHLESPNEGSSIDHQVTIHLHAQNITMFPTNETWYFTSQMLFSSSGGLILILTAQSTRNEFRMHSDY